MPARVFLDVVGTHEPGVDYHDSENVVCRLDIEFATERPPADDCSTDVPHNETKQNAVS